MKLGIFKKMKLPDKPGVYFFKQGKNILYIGKATSLRSRVRSYFSSDLIRTRGMLLVDMVSKSDDIKWEASDSVLEALIFEANLIKKYQPFYNRQEKDDRSFNYVCITRGKIPIVKVVRGKLLQNQNILSDSEDSYTGVFGPFTNGGQLQEALKIIRPIFPFLDERSKNYYEFYKQVDWVPNINTQEGIKQYRRNIKNLKLFFEGKKKMILKNLEKEMKAYAKVREFEKAGEVKNRIFALKHINDVALIKGDNPSSDMPNLEIKGRDLLVSRVEGGRAYRMEAYDIAHMSGKNMVGVLTVVENGAVVKGDYKKFRIRTQSGSNDTGALTEVLERRLRHQEWGYPNLIVIDGGMGQINAAKAVLHRMDLHIEVAAVVKDDRHKAKAILGYDETVRKYKSAILLANSEAHRFAIAYHKNMRGRNFLGKLKKK